MPIKISRNRDWDRASPEAKKLFIENLPFHYTLVFGIFFALAYGIPIIFRYFFAEFKYTDITTMAMIGIYTLYIVISTLRNYKRKTGRDLNVDITEIQSKYELKKSKIISTKEKLFLNIFLFVVSWSIVAVGIWLIYGSDETPPFWVYLVILFAFLFPFIWKHMEYKAYK